MVQLLQRFMSDMMFLHQQCSTGDTMRTASGVSTGQGGAHDLAQTDRTASRASAPAPAAESALQPFSPSKKMPGGG
jgi:hypothetical protein